MSSTKETDTTYNTNTAGFESYPVFSGVRVTRSLVLYIMFCRSLFVLLYFFLWPLYCLSFDLRILI